MLKRHREISILNINREGVPLFMRVSICPSESFRRIPKMGLINKMDGVARPTDHSPARQSFWRGGQEALTRINRNFIHLYFSFIQIILSIDCFIFYNPEFAGRNINKNFFATNQFYLSFKLDPPLRFIIFS